jgi:hypothetical protein
MAFMDGRERTFQILNVDSPPPPWEGASNPAERVQQAGIVARLAARLQMYCLNRLPRERLIDTAANLRKALDQFDRACGI